MALKFENVGTCLIVKQYLDRSREVLRQELMQKISSLLMESSTERVQFKDSPTESTTDDDQVKTVNTF
jgi:hypothetical protein